MHITKMLCLKRFSKLVLEQTRNNTRFCSSGALVDISMNDKTGIAVVTLQRPPVNSLNLELLQSLSDALDEVESKRTKGVILTSNNPSIFSAGLDITEMYKPDLERAAKFWKTLQTCWVKLFGSTYPTAAAINGHSPAGGCLLSISCEYRVMVEGKYRVGLNETALGIVAPQWFQTAFKNVLPVRIAEVALTTGKMFSVEEALKCGLIDETATDKADAVTKCEKFIGRFAKISPDARAKTKLSFRSQILQDFEDRREADLDHFLTYVQGTGVQKNLEIYMTSLKNKSK